MSDKVEAARAHSVSGRIVHGLQILIRRLAWLAACVAPAMLRVALAVPFYRSGLTKWDGFLSLAPSAQYLFEEEFQLHLLGHAYGFPFPDVLAYLDGVGEIVLPVLLLLGLATRLSALGILCMVGVIQLTVPSAWATFHLPWAGLALGIMALGPGALSLDRLIERWVAPRFAAPPV
jgi:putative oxidoreductase